MVAYVRFPSSPFPVLHPFKEPQRKVPSATTGNSLLNWTKFNYKAIIEINESKTGMVFQALKSNSPIRFFGSIIIIDNY